MAPRPMGKNGASWGGLGQRRLGADGREVVRCALGGKLARVLGELRPVAATIGWPAS